MTPGAASVEVIPSCRWLPTSLDPVLARTVRIAHGEIGVEENEGANNSPRIREYLATVKSPIRSSWCAAFTWWSVLQAGGKIPPQDGGSCDASRDWAIKHGLWVEAKGTTTPLPGWLTIYGTVSKDGVVDAHHAGVLARIGAQGLRDIEGNTTWSGYSREGVCVAMKPVYTTQLLGFIKVEAA